MENNKSKFLTKTLAGTLSGTILALLSFSIIELFFHFRDGFAIIPLGILLGSIVGITIINNKKTTDYSKIQKSLIGFLLLLFLIILIVTGLYFFIKPPERSGFGGFEFLAPIILIIIYLWSSITSLLIIGLLSIMRKVIAHINS